MADGCGATAHAPPCASLRCSPSVKWATGFKIQATKKEEQDKKKKGGRGRRALAGGHEKMIALSNVILSNVVLTLSK